MTCHRTECYEIEKALKEKLTQVEEELAASQAREQVLRDEIRAIAKLQREIDVKFLRENGFPVAAMALGPKK